MNESLKIQLADLTVLEYIDKGSSGMVSKAIHNQTQTLMALKVVILYQ